MLVHKGGQTKNWSEECRDVITTKLQCQTIQRALQSQNLQREIIKKKYDNFHQLILSYSLISYNISLTEGTLEPLKTNM